MTGLGAHVLILLDGIEDIYPRTLRRAFAFAAPNSSLILERRADPESEEAFTAIVDGQMFGLGVYVGQAPAPYSPVGQSQCPFWRRGPREVEDHVAFAAIAAAEIADRPSAYRAQTLAMTRLASALVEEMPALGVIWGAARNCSPPGLVAAAPANINRGRWPADLWIGYQAVSRLGPDRMSPGVQTVGAQPLLGFELQVGIEPATGHEGAVRLLCDAASTLLRNGDVVRDGDILRLNGWSGAPEDSMRALHLGAGGNPHMARLSTLAPA